ncbi:MAG: oligosaccharide flippase family protein, partial [Gammaproteobacteria bacterium]|nr:oligosaccharide flippase family protein [Gammaproteobacteria bacterium]
MTKIFKIPVFKNGMLKDVGVIASGSALGYVVAFIASPVLTRLYSPDDFGLFTVYLSLYSIFSMLIAGKYDNAIPLPLTEKTATHVAKLALVISLFTSFLIFLCTISFGDRFLSFIHSSALKEYLWLLPLSLLLVGIYQVLFNWALRRKAFGVISYNGFQQRLIQVLVQIVCGFISFGALGLIGGFIMAQVLSLFTLYFALDAKIILLQKAK